MNSSEAPLTARGQSRAARALLGLLNRSGAGVDSSILQQLSADDWEALLDHATTQHVRPLVHQRLAGDELRAHVPPRFQERLTTTCRAIARRQLAMRAELVDVLTILNGEGIPVVLLKGAALWTSVFPNVALREMADLDLMVPRADAERAAHALIAHGYRAIDRMPADWLTTGLHHQSLAKPNGALVEVHWALAPHGTPGSECTDALWREIQPVDVDGQRAFVLSQIDQLLHVAIHLAYLHKLEFGLRPYCDAMRLIDFYGPEFDWAALVRTAEARGWLHGVLLALLAARELVGANVPTSLDAHVHDPALVTAAAALTWITPAEVKSLRREVTALSIETSWPRRIRVVWSRWFVPKAELIDFYRASESSWWWPLLYIRRAGYLMRRHTGDAARALSKRDVTQSVAMARSTVEEWLKPCL